MATPQPKATPAPATVLTFRPADLRTLVRHVCVACGHRWQHPARARRCLLCGGPVDVIEVTRTEAERI